MRWAAAVISRTGRSARPATSQPSATDITVMMARAISEAIASWLVSLSWPGWLAGCDCRFWSWACSVRMRAWAWASAEPDRA